MNGRHKIIRTGDEGSTMKHRTEICLPHHRHVNDRSVRWELENTKRVCYTIVFYKSQIIILSPNQWLYVMKHANF